jgi:hypothetical protein
MDASLLDECTLCIGHKVIHEGGKLDGKNLSDDLCNGMNQADMPILGDLLGPLFLIGKRTMLAEFNH